MVTVDGTDCLIFEPRPWDPIWHSERFNGPGVCCETGVCIQTGWIVWTNGPFAAGVLDWKIACEALNCELEGGELCIADSAHTDGRQHAETSNGLKNLDQSMKSTAWARHEAVNCWLKHFSSLN